MTHQDSGTRCHMADCRYFSESGCAYFIATGTTRLFTHLGEGVNINNPCREYDPGDKDLLRTEPFCLGKDLC